MIKVSHSKGAYEIVFNRFEPGAELIVTDSNLVEIYPWIKTRPHIVVPAGEQSKSIEQFGSLCAELAKKRTSRKSVIVAFGGGVIGDLVGFAAATYMRGIEYIQVPTTLLSQVDSSVGGKVGIDLPEGKNLLGSFHPPKRVVIDCDLLKTLDERQIRCGMAEVIKYAWIMDPKLLDRIQANEATENLVKRCVELKAKVVMEDEFEIKGIRAWLNFGHTVGHAIEQITEYKIYTHGEAISIGMVAEAKIAEKLGFAKINLADDVARTLAQKGLPVSFPKFSFNQIINTMLLDKKSVDGTITMSLVSELGKCELVSGISPTVIQEVWGS